MPGAASESAVLHHTLVECVYLESTGPPRLIVTTIASLFYTSLALPGSHANDVIFEFRVERNQVGLRSGATGVLRCSSSGKPRPEKRPGCYWRGVGWCAVFDRVGPSE